MSCSTRSSPALGQPLLRAGGARRRSGHRHRAPAAPRAAARRSSAVDPGPGVLSPCSRARSTSRVRPVVGDGNALPLRDAAFDLVTYAQSWHWTDPERSVPEAARVLHDRGVLATWWNRHDLSVPWFARHQERLFAACGWTGHEDESWVAELLAGPRWQRRVATVDIPWRRRMSLADFGRNIATKSYVFALGDRAAEVVAAELTELEREHPDGFLDEPFSTYAVLARR